MTAEWKRLLLNKKVLWMVVLLLIANIVLFLFVSLDEDVRSTRSQTIQRTQLFQAHQRGELTLRELEEQIDETEAIFRMFYFRFMKQTSPEEYVLYVQAEEATFRREYPQIAKAFDQGAYDEAIILQKRVLLRTVYDSSVYPAVYKTSLERIQINAQLMSGIGIFQSGDGAVNRNIQKTAEDYAVLEGVSITPGNDASTVALFGYGFLPVFGIVFSVVLVGKLLEERRYGLQLLVSSCENGRGALTSWRAAGLILGSGLFSVLLYGSTMLLSIYLFGLVDAGRMAQSVPELFGLTVPMTLGKLWMLFLGLGITTQIMISGLVWCVYSFIEHRMIAATLLGGVLGGSLLLYRVIPHQSVISFLKYTNLASVMDFGAMLRSYQNVSLGPLLIEKNILVAGVMLLLLVSTFALAIWCGIRGYRVTGHGRVYRAFRFFFEKMSQLYHRAISHMPPMVLEGYKILIIQRGLPVLILLAVILCQVYPVKEPIYMGETEFMREFYSRFESKPITEDVLQYVHGLEEQLEQIDVEWIRAQADYQSGAISPEEYEIALRKYEAYEIQRQGLACIMDSIDYIRRQEEQGHRAVFVNPMVYDYLLGEYSPTDWVMDWLGVFVTVILCAGIFSVERKNGLQGLLYSTEKGRIPLAVRKCLLGVILSGMVYGLLTAIRGYSIIASYGIESLGASVYSLPMFAACPVGWPLGCVIVLYLISGWLVYGVIAMTACLLSQLLSYELSICAAVVAMVPGVLEGIGVGIFEKGGIGRLEKGAASWLVNGKWGIAVALIIAIIGLAVCNVCIWRSGTRREK